MSTPIHTIATWTIKEGQLEMVLTALQELSAKSRTETGNLFYNVLQDNANPNTLIVYEGYADETALNAHRNSSHYIGLVVEKIRPLLANRQVVLTTPLDL